MFVLQDKGLGGGVPQHNFCSAGGGGSLKMIFVLQDGGGPENHVMLQDRGGGLSQKIPAPNPPGQGVMPHPWN